MKIKIKNAGCASDLLNIYKELLKKYSPVETTLGYYTDGCEETYQYPA